MLVASIDPLIVYYHDGLARVSTHKYDKHSTDVKNLEARVNKSYREMPILLIVIWMKMNSRK